MSDNKVQQPPRLLADPEQVALVRGLIRHARYVHAEHATYGFNDSTGRLYGPVEHTWTAGEARVSYSEGELIYKRHGVPILHARHVTHPRQVSDLLAAIGVLPQWFASAYHVGRSDGRWIANTETNPDRRCRRCGVRTGLKPVFSGIAYRLDGWECRDGCTEVTR